MTIKRTILVLLLLLMPLVTYALPLSTSGTSSNTTLFFFNTLYSSRLLNIISDDTCLLSNGTIPSPCPGTLTGSLPQPPSEPLTFNVSCNTNPDLPAPNPAPVPEPATMLLVGSGMMGIASFRMFFHNK
jgi:hypothetical protein